LQAKGPNGPWTRTYSIRSVQSLRNGHTATLTVQSETSAGKSTATEVYRSDSSGLALISDGYGTYNPPLPITQALLEKGKNWTWSGTVGNGRDAVPASAVMAVSGPDEVVALGPSHQKYMAMSVSVELKRNVQGKEQSNSMTYCFAPGVGPVRLKFSFLMQYTLIGK
jgi:hypothetical protein